MNYALSLAVDGRVLSATFPEHATKDAVLVESLPEGDIHDYLYVDGEFVYDPIPVIEPEPEATADDVLNALLGVTE